MKPGELERNLSRLVEAARTAGERLAAMKRELAALRLEMESLAAAQPEAEPRRAESSGEGKASAEVSGVSRRERGEAARPESDSPGREAGSE